MKLFEMKVEDKLNED